MLNNLKALSYFMLLTGLAIFSFFIFSPGETELQTPGPKYSSQPPVKKNSVYRFAVHALHNPARMMAAYQPLIDYLNENLTGGRILLEASRDYADFEEKYQAGKPEFILPNPWQTIQAINTGYAVIAEAGDPKDFKGIFIVRKDGGITSPADLKGRAVSYPSPTALAACIMPQYFLHDKGIDVNKDIENRYVGSQESSIMNVYLKKTAAGATWPPPWRAFQVTNPGEAAELKIIWETESFINNSVMARKDVPPAIRERVRKRLLTLHETERGRRVLSGMETARFLPAADADYGVVRDYIERFEKEVRKVVIK